MSAEGRDVVIIGGGDTGNDCVATAIRGGCRSVVQIEMMPEPPGERLPSNPWPEWPKVKKTDYGQLEAIARFGSDPRVYGTTVKEVMAREGAVCAVRTVGVIFKDGKLVEVPGTEKEIPCTLLLIAAGFVGCEDYVAEAFGLARTRRGTAETPAGSYAAAGGPGGLFAAGDMRRGQSLVVWAIAEGRACAREVDEYLMG